jgi:uncharacterized membrane protein YfbV (UPF0208 family)
MAQMFEHPSNGHTEMVSGWSALWVLLFGGLYLLFKGLWAHVLTWLILGIGLSIALAVPIPAFVVTIVYAFTIQGILERQYLRKGWRAVTDEEPVEIVEWVDGKRKLVKRNDLGASAPVSPEPTRRSIADELNKLADLRDRNLLSAAEFNAQKSKLLAE